MDFSDYLYIIGLILVLMYLLTGSDDLIWDLATLFKRTQYRKQIVDLHKLDAIPPKLLAVVIAAWHEDNVLGDVIENIIASAHYPRSRYHIFLGIYPNDPATHAVAGALAKKYPNIHIVVNNRPGPTSKAQNINYVISQIKEFERRRRWLFASITIHDSEDVVHPYELKMTNYLLEKYKALQFPVFPLMQMPKFKNFFRNITTSTYADEFAENHFSTMVSRYSAGAFVPSAGTGFVLARDIIDAFGDADILPSDSLTEDYRLSLTLFEKGIQMYYVLERVPRINDEGKLIDEFVATRSMFPKTFKTAVKQKARWILGITMQSFRFRDIFHIKGLRFAGRYSLYKDMKAKVGNLLIVLGYPVLIYFLVSLFIPLTPIYPKGTLSWYLCLAVTVMMVERQLFRSVAIFNVYGMRSVFFACLLPPILPIRLIWGNIINMSATLKAYRQKIFGVKQQKEKNSVKSAKKKIVWDKTDHAFLEKPALRRYHRTIGDVMLEKGYVTSDQLKEALKMTRGTPQTIGNYLLKNGTIDEEQLLDALSHVKHTQYIEAASVEEYHPAQFAPAFDEKLLRALKTLPLLKTKSGYVFAVCDNSAQNVQTVLRDKYGVPIGAVLATEALINKGLNSMYAPNAIRMQAPSALTEAYENSTINYEQLIIARNFVASKHISEEEILQNMGLRPDYIYALLAEE